MHYSLRTILNTFVEQGDHFHPEKNSLRNDLRFCGEKFLLTIYLIDCIFICRCKCIKAIYFSSQLSLLLLFGIWQSPPGRGKNTKLECAAVVLGD